MGTATYSLRDLTVLKKRPKRDPFSFLKETSERPLTTKKKETRNQLFSSSDVLLLFNNKHLNKFIAFPNWPLPLCAKLYFLKFPIYFLLLYIATLSKNPKLKWQKRPKKRRPNATICCKKETFQMKRDLKETRVSPKETQLEGVETCNEEKNLEF